MWRHPIVRRNVRTLIAASYRVVPPVGGVEASTLRRREGGMPSFVVIVWALRAALK